ncbi:dTDP-4-dehydrorhamnose reductase family protein [Polaromonas sp. P5_D5]
MRVLVLGASGMIGSAMIRVLSQKKDWQVFGSMRNAAALRFFEPAIAERMLTFVDINDRDSVIRAFAHARPDVVINCIGLTKHHTEADDPLLAIPINALLPHQLAGLCLAASARLIHISTDCVFSGSKGHYIEADAADAKDVYGKSKLLGEVLGQGAITLRTSTIGHELQSAYGLLEWFLAQQGSCKGFNKAIFSGLPNVVFAEIVRDIVIPRPELTGLYHVGASPIGKYDLLKLIAAAYGKAIDIQMDNTFTMDRSLDSSRFREATGYTAPAWPELIDIMHSSKL